MYVGAANDKPHPYPPDRSGSDWAGAEAETRTDAAVAARVPLFRCLNRPVAPLLDAFVTDRELQQVFDPRRGAWTERKYVPSLLAAIGGVIEKHLRAIGFLDAGEAAPADATVGDSGSVTTGPGSGCGRCGALAEVRTERCDLCNACGYSTCG